MNLHHNFRRSRKGIGTVFGMVFFLLITMIVFASFMVILNQNTSLEQTVIQTRQIDNDKANEQISIIQQPTLDLFTNKGLTSVTVNCNLTNSGTIPLQVVRLWVKDLSTNISESKPILSNDNIHVLQQGQSKNYTGIVNLQIANPSNDQFAFWFVTSRGNQFTLNQQSEVNINNIVNQGISNVLGDFLPDYRSLQWAQVNSATGQIIGSWTSGWIIPSNLGNINMVWRINLVYHGTIPITIDQYSMLDYIPFSSNPGNSFTITPCYIVGYTSGTIKSYVSNEITVNPSTGGTQVTLYFGSANQPNLNSGISNSEIFANGDMLSLTIYGQAPNIYAQSFPLYAIFTRNVPVINLTPTSGRIGLQVTVSGSNFVPSSIVTITFDGATVATTTATSSGTLPTGASAPKFTVPTTYAGVHSISAKDGFNTGSATFTVNPSILINPTSGPRNSQNTVTVSGTGFSANSVVIIKFDNSQQLTTPATINTDNNGSFSAVTFTVTPGGNNGKTHPVTAADQDSNTAQATFTGS